MSKTSWSRCMRINRINELRGAAREGTSPDVVRVTRRMWDGADGAEVRRGSGISDDYFHGVSIYIDNNIMSSKSPIYRYKSNTICETPTLTPNLTTKKHLYNSSQSTVLFEGEKEGQRGSQNKANFTSLLMAQRITHLHRLAAGHQVQG